MSGRVRPDSANRLIVEGRDDQWSIIALTSLHGWDWNGPSEQLPFIDNAEGVDKALEAIAVSVRTYSRVGIVLDADLALTNRWNAVCARLSPLGFPMPASPAHDGTIIHANGKIVGVWLMPDNQAAGKLEDFLAVLVPKGTKSWPWAEQVASAAKAIYDANFSDPDLIKAQIHTWLAWQREPGLPFGTAIRAAAFAHDAPLAIKFVDWLTRLYF